MPTISAGRARRTATIATASTSTGQLLVAAPSTGVIRFGCTLWNRSSDTLYIEPVPSGGSWSLAKAAPWAPGQAFYCTSPSGVVEQAAIWASGPSTSDAMALWVQ